ncbi:MAG: DNA topoisomerase I [Candidatus Bathyarchaeota archaeon]|nr:DNA topoisomerase I [Candidatus Bathyarchaeota archaeon]
MHSVNTLHHNGVIVPPRYEGRGLTVKIKGQPARLRDEQEEMAFAWAKKFGTPYVDDPKFAENFHEDFGKALGLKLLPGDVDFTDIIQLVQREREEKQNLAPEVKKAQAAERKAQRESNKEMYGYATVDGQRMELGNYNVEPNSIFMGRGQHPWRGRWKQGPGYEDIELNLSPDAPRPPGNWKAIVWEPDKIWIARWTDRLSGKKKYVWPGDASFLKQRKDIEKYDKARALKERLDEVKAHIEGNLTVEDLKRRKVATVCYLIDRLKFRVGDEKDEDDEADTVGASTLRPEHVCFNGDGSVTFNFLGKDSVPMNITANLPPRVVQNLRDFTSGAGKESLFEGINSGHVGDFLKEIMEGLSAKVFRTLYATDAVGGKLATETVKPEDPDYVKRQAALRANLEAAIVCNHKRTIPKTWPQSLQAKKDRLRQLEEKASVGEKAMRQRLVDEEKNYREKLVEAENRLAEAEKREGELRAQLAEVEASGGDDKAPRKRLAAAREKTKSARERVRKLKNAYVTGSMKLRKQLEKRRRRDGEAVERMRLQVEAQEITRDYNLGTSLKNYVDPRIYYDWGKRVGFDWRSYYPTTLQKKFSWIEEQPEDEES